MRVGWQSCFNKKKKFFFWLLYEKNFCRYMKKFLNLVAIFFIWLLYFFIWLLYEFLGENMLLYYWYLGWNKHFRITFSKHRLPKATTNARVAEFKIDLQPRVSNVHIMHDMHPCWMISRCSYRPTDMSLRPPLSRTRKILDHRFLNRERHFGLGLLHLEMKYQCESRNQANILIIFIGKISIYTMMHGLCNACMR